MIAVNMRRGAYGIREAEVEPRYELLGEFLTVEGSTLNSWACEEVFAVALAIKEGEELEFRKSGNAHSVQISINGVLIQSEYREPPAHCELPLEDFVGAIKQWKVLLTQMT